MKHKCCWILSKGGELPVRYCGAPVRYTLVKDDDRRKQRKYATFCDEHAKQAKAMDEAEEAADTIRVALHNEAGPAFFTLNGKKPR